MFDVDDDDTEVDTHDPIYTAPIYFLAPNQELTGRQGMAMSEIIKEANHAPTKIKVPPQPLKSYINRLDLTTEEFKDCLKVYEDNQGYMSDNGMKDKLRSLETWFIQVIEPPPRRRPRMSSEDRADMRLELGEWREREMSKIAGYSYYCDHKLRKSCKVDHRIMLQVKKNMRAIDVGYRDGRFNI